MTALKRSCGSMTCRGSGPCAGSPLAATTGSRCGRQTARASPFNPIVHGDLAIFWQPVEGTGTAERLTTPVGGTAHVPESWSPRGETLLFSVEAGSDAELWMVTLRDRTATPFGDIRSSTPIGAVFSPDGRVGGLRKRRARQANDLRATLSGDRGQVPTRRERCRHAVSRGLVTGWESALLQPKATGPRGGQRHDGADVRVRQLVTGAEAISVDSTGAATVVRHHARRQVRGAGHARGRIARHAQHAADAGGAQLVRRAPNARADEPVRTLTRIRCSLWASRRPPGKARGARIPGVCKRRATQPGGMHRRPQLRTPGSFENPPQPTPDRPCRVARH